MPQILRSSDRAGNMGIYQNVIELEFIKPESKGEMVKRDTRWNKIYAPRPKRI